MTISEIIQKYKNQIDYLDLEILIAHSLGKTREFVLTYPEHSVTSNQQSVINKKIQQRISSEPLAYILGHKEFYGLDLIVNKHTLIPRPETEMMVENALSSVISHHSSGKKITIIDIGTGSGCIITSIAHAMQNESWNMVQKNVLEFFATDISKGALNIAKKNAKLNGVDKKIKFLQGNLLSPFSKFIQDTKYKIQDTNLIITANLPYLSDKIYNSALVDVKKYEPKSALYSDEQGLKHYRELLEQIKELKSELQPSITALLEISPEQKIPIKKIIKNILPTSKIEFKKDLAGKWRLCKIILN